MAEALEPLQNKVSEGITPDKNAFKVVFSDPQGNVLFSDSIIWDMRWDAPLFTGYAFPGTSEDNPSWIVQKMTFKDKLPVKRQVLINIRWTERVKEFENLQKET